MLNLDLSEKKTESEPTAPSQCKWRRARCKQAVQWLCNNTGPTSSLLARTKAAENGVLADTVLHCSARLRFWHWCVNVVKRPVHTFVAWGLPDLVRSLTTPVCRRPSWRQLIVFLWKSRTLWWSYREQTSLVLEFVDLWYNCNANIWNQMREEKNARSYCNICWVICWISYWIS